MQIDLLLGVISFSGIVLALVAVIIAARSKLVSTGNVSIEINGDSSNPIVVPAGSKLLQTLAENKIFLSSACGGGGHAVNASVLFLMVVDQFYLLKNLILILEKKMKVGDFRAKFLLKVI